MKQRTVLQRGERRFLLVAGILLLSTIVQILNAAQPPTVSITSPANGAFLAIGATITISASATDADGTVTKVELFNGATKLGEKTTRRYTYTVANAPAGTYRLTARATGSTSMTISFQQPGDHFQNHYCEIRNQPGLGINALGNND